MSQAAICPLHSFCSVIKIHLRQHPQIAVASDSRGGCAKQAAGLQPSSFCSIWSGVGLKNLHSIKFSHAAGLGITFGERHTRTWRCV